MAERRFRGSDFTQGASQPPVRGGRRSWVPLDAGFPLQGEEKGLIQPPGVHQAQQAVGIQAPEDINDGEIVVDHCAAEAIAIAELPQPRPGLFSRQQGQQPGCQYTQGCQAPHPGCPQQGHRYPVRIDADAPAARRREDQGMDGLGAEEAFAVPMPGLQHPIQGMARGQALAAPIPQQLGWGDGRELVEQGQGRAAGVDLVGNHGERLRWGRLGCCQPTGVQLALTCEA